MFLEGYHYKQTKLRLQKKKPHYVYLVSILGPLVTSQPGFYRNQDKWGENPAHVTLKDNVQSLQNQLKTKSENGLN